MAHAQRQKPQGAKENALASTKGHLSTTAISLQRSLYKVAVVEKFNVIKGGCWKQKKKKKGGKLIKLLKKLKMFIFKKKNSNVFETRSSLGYDWLNIFNHLIIYITRSFRCFYEVKLR